MEDQQKEEIAEIVNLFDRAEDLVKEVEKSNGELSIPSINELRYVGYHLARALSTDPSSDVDAEISKAKNHCKRAIYDAYEVGIIFFLENLRQFSERHVENSDHVLAVIPTYVEDLAAVQKASDFIGDIKKNYRNDRDQYYVEAQPHYQVLREISGKFLAAEPLVQRAHRKAIKRDRRQTRRFITTTLLSILGIAVVCFGVVSKLKSG